MPEDASGNLSVTETLRAKLQAAYTPANLEIIDDSEQHRGHGGYREGGESHFTVIMKSTEFVGKSRVDCQRMVMKTLADDLAGPVHALQLRLSAPTE